MKRRLVKLVVFLLLGAAVNVAVAWGCVHAAREFQFDPVLSRTSARDGRIDESERLSDLGWQQIPVSGRTTHVQLHPSVIVATGVSIRIVTEEEGWATESAGGGYNRTALAVTSAGWPCLAMQGLRFDASRPSARQNGQSTWVYQDAIAWPHGVEMFYGCKMMPLRPLWLGFSSNTLLYAAIRWLFFAAPFALRRWLRVRRGQCPACSYPIGASPVCTECGKAVKPKAEASA